MMKPQSYTAIIGLGKTGLSCLKFLDRLGESLVVIDSRETPPELAYCREHFPHIEHHFGSLKLDYMLNAKQLILSPGINPNLPEIVACKQKGIPILGDIELFAQHATAPVIAITGTNGKSTVTTLTGELFKAAGYRVKVGGNLGLPALDLLDGEIADYYVLELSSFQLDLTYSLKPECALITNITPDHLDRHGDLEPYIQSKHRIYHHAKTLVYKIGRAS